jgi:hypothetical protein
MLSHSWAGKGCLGATSWCEIGVIGGVIGVTVGRSSYCHCSVGSQ